MRVFRIPALILAPLLAGLAPPANALETDPILVLDVKLDDSSGVLNEYVNSEIHDQLNRLRVGRPQTCEEVVPILFNRFRQTPMPRITRWALNRADLHRFPDETVKRSAYYRQSILGQPFYSSFGVPLGRIINVGGVYFSADKLGHLFSFGRRYQRRYLRASYTGMPDEEALRKIVRWGFNSEMGQFGRTSTGIISFADLEANYQGFRLARSLCDPDSPAHLTPDENGFWKITGSIDLRDYVNADWDEAFNPNIYVKRRWKNIRERMLEHCDKLDSQIAMERFGSYAATYTPSHGERIANELARLRGLPSREDFSLHSVCGREVRPGDAAHSTASETSRPMETESGS